MFDLFADYETRVVALGAGALGIVSGALGSFAVLRKQSLLGDAVSHAALPGVALAFLLTRSKTPLVLVLGAALAGWLAVLLATSIIRTTRIKEDSALGLALAVFFGLGMVLKSYTQRNVSDASQAGLDRFLFGHASSMVQEDVVTIAVLGGAAILVLLVFWKQFKLLSFDRDFASSLGLHVRALDILLLTLLVVAIVIGLQMVGVVLMSAMIVAPAAAARQWTDRLGLMVVLAALFGAVAGVGGAILSSRVSLPTGPTIVLWISAMVLASLLFAPNRGLVFNAIRQWRQDRQLRLEAALLDLYELALQHPDQEHGHAVAVLQTMRMGHGDVRRSLAELADREWARQNAAGEWTLTPAGRAEAEHLREGRT
jgi:manganese/zinc/iron transport system permease protein